MKRILIAIAGLIMALALGGASAQSEFEPREYSIGADQVRSISISVIDRSVDVSPSPDGNVYLSCCESAREYYDISLDEGALTVELRQDKQWYDFIGGKSPEVYRAISLQLPADMLDSLVISTTNEPVSLEGISLLQSVDISANGGDISFKALNAGQRIALSSKNGGISGTLRGPIDDYAIETAIKKGDCNLPERMGGGNKALSASANNGDISIEFE